jgi:hypothetical protein
MCGLKLKFIVGLFLVFVIGSNTFSGYVQAQNKSQTSSSLKHQAELLTRKWNIREPGILCNVCPQIVFKPNNTAEIINADNSMKKVNWLILKNDVLNISTNSVFNNVKYQIHFERQKEYLELRLSNNKKLCYILSSSY